MKPDALYRFLAVIWPPKSEAWPKTRAPRPARSGRISGKTWSRSGFCG